MADVSGARMLPCGPVAYEVVLPQSNNVVAGLPESSHNTRGPTMVQEMCDGKNEEEVSLFFSLHGDLHRFEHFIVLLGQNLRMHEGVHLMKLGEVAAPDSVGHPCILVGDGRPKSRAPEFPRHSCRHCSVFVDGGLLIEVARLLHVVNSKNGLGGAELLPQPAFEPAALGARRLLVVLVDPAGGGVEDVECLLVNILQIHPEVC
mmetsp:Transcript_122488/g.305902  ORF Transcript_122488/g.305902 Transcript_122488/m.305902 type:complete len:204 (-) Transcript_122488:372-983(-)